jgi:SAM-dependent MidA family methyltransferase
MTDQDPLSKQQIAQAEAELARLPQPDAEAAAHSERLLAHIRAQIDAAGGSLSFARFMELALYAPGLGYYVAGARKFGSAGDFVTAPEISPLFGRCVAHACAEVLAALGGGDILEFGPGRGLMAADLLLELEALECLPGTYFLLEVSPELRERQRQTLAERVPHLSDKVRWLDRLPEAGLRGVVLANEVLDAMAVERFRIDRGAVCQAYVTWRDDRLMETFAPASDQLTAAVRRIEADLGEPLADGYRSEVHLALRPWLATLADFMEQGIALLIDYGYPRREYYHPQRANGTLLCHYRHRAHDRPLTLVGLQDITAYVDFTAVAEAAVDAGLELAGFTTQAHFLIGSGLERLMTASDPGDPAAHLELARQLKVLTLPGEMGERFKVMALSRGLDLTLAGLAVRDLRGRL